MWERIKNNIFGKNTNTIDYIIVGLGNPGKKYEKTAHNVGFRVLQKLYSKGEFSPLVKEKYFNALFAKGVIVEKKIAIILPLTFMNLSGLSVKKTMARLNVKPKNIIVVHDDTDLNLGVVRFSFARGSAGHKGVESVIGSIGSKNFIRVRVGVKKENKRARDVVLKNTPSFLSKVEERVVLEIIESLSTGQFLKTINIKDDKQKST